MVEITKETVEGLCMKKEDKNTFTLIFTVISCSAVIITAVVSSLSVLFSDRIPYLQLKTIIMLVIAMTARIIVGCISGSSRGLNAVSKEINGDFLSDKAIDVLFEKMGKTEHFSEKTMLIILLGNIYRIRGQYKEALSMIGSVDRSQFTGYPEMGLYYYYTVTGIYTELGDNDSVLAAFSDAEPFIDECACRNYNCCMTALGIIICGERAKGNYSKALELAKMKIGFEEKLVSFDVPKSSVLKDLICGKMLLEKAELEFLDGHDIDSGYSEKDYYNKIQFDLNTIKPLISASQAFKKLSDDLSVRISEKLRLEGHFNG